MLITDLCGFSCMIRFHVIAESTARVSTAGSGSYFPNRVRFSGLLPIRYRRGVKPPPGYAFLIEAALRTRYGQSTNSALAV